MTKPILAALILLAAAASFAEDAAATIKAAYAAMDRLAAKRDAQAMARYFAEDFTFKPKQGPTMGKKESLKQLEAQFKMAKKFVAKSTVRSIKVSGNQAVATVTQSARIVFANPQTKKDSNVDVLSDTRDTWVKTASGWKVKKIESLKESMKLDGKSMSGSGGKG